VTVVGQSTLVVVRRGPTRLSAFPCGSPGPGRARWRPLPAFSAREEERRLRHGPHAATTATRSRSTRQQTASPGHPWRKTSTTSSRSRPGAASVSAPPPLPSRKPLNPHRVSVDATPRDHTCIARSAASASHALALAAGRRSGAPIGRARCTRLADEDGRARGRGRRCGGGGGDGRRAPVLPGRAARRRGAGDWRRGRPCRVGPRGRRRRGAREPGVRPGRRRPVRGRVGRPRPPVGPRRAALGRALGLLRARTVRTPCQQSGFPCMHDARMCNPVLLPRDHDLLSAMLPLWSWSIACAPQALVRCAVSGPAGWVRVRRRRSTYPLTPITASASHASCMRRHVWCGRVVWCSS
jgi:hypothetical protein